MLIELSIKYVWIVWIIANPLEIGDCDVESLQYSEAFASRLSSNSEAVASELLDNLEANLEDMFHQ